MSEFNNLSFKLSQEFESLSDFKNYLYEYNLFFSHNTKNVRDNKKFKKYICVENNCNFQLNIETCYVRLTQIAISAPSLCNRTCA